MNSKAVNLSVIFAIISITIMTILAELSKSFKDFLTQLTGHHWISKSLISLIIFFIIYLSLRGIKPKLKDNNIYYTIILTIVLSIIILLFFTIESLI